jgi:hypothetical protein
LIHLLSFAVLFGLAQSFGLNIFLLILFYKLRVDKCLRVEWQKAGAGMSHKWSEEILPLFYVLNNPAGSPPHSTTIIDIMRFLISVVNLRFAVL